SAPRKANLTEGHEIVFLQFHRKSEFILVGQKNLWRE
ncbi:uncharacterized protein METZ01_LOCUS226773, partial [marine metagenome]